MKQTGLSRRDWLRGTAAFGLTASSSSPLAASLTIQAGGQPEVLDIGSRRELFIDSHLIDRMNDGVSLRLNHPVPRELVLVHDQPWEGSGSGYHSIFQDGSLYRMYYKAWHLEPTQGKLNNKSHPLYCCYAESDDGVRWRKPELGLHEFQGSKKNNISIASGPWGPLNVDAGHPAVFKDENPNSASDARYKAILRSSAPNALLPFKSSDGIHWSPMTDEAMLAKLGAFDSQNLAFWDPAIAKYRAYWRIFKEGIRDIRTATSDDLVHWSTPVDLIYEDSPAEHLYTNQVKPYHRAPHILIGFPTRYIDRGWSDSMKDLPQLKHRELRASSVERYGTAVTEALLMASRDGLKFKRWNEAFLRPGVQRPDTWNYGHQYIAWHLVETRSDLTGAPNELSLYAVESYWTGKGSALRRYTLRLDGFVSLNAPMSGGEVVTPPLKFSGSQLSLNFATSAAGSVRVELQNPTGKPIDQFSLTDCPNHFGDTIQRTVTWKNGSDLSSLRGKPTRLRIQLRDADLYSLRFQG